MDTEPKFIKEIKLVPISHKTHEEVLHYFIFALFYTMGSNDFTRFMQLMKHPGRSKITAAFREMRGYSSSVQLYVYSRGYGMGPEDIIWSAIDRTFVAKPFIADFIRTFAGSYSLTTIINYAEAISRYGVNDVFSVIGNISHAMNKSNHSKLFKIEVEFA